MFFDDGNPSFTKLEALYQYIEGTSLEVLSVDNVVFFPYKIYFKVEIYTKAKHK